MNRKELVSAKRALFVEFLKTESENIQDYDLPIMQALSKDPDIQAILQRLS